MGKASVQSKVEPFARRLILVLIGGLALARLAPAALTDGPLVYAIKDARVVTVTNGTLAQGTVVVRDGLIEAVGERVDIPADARIIDGSGLTVYPGLIDAHTDVAMEPPPPPAQPGRQQAGGGAPQQQTPAAPAIKLGQNADRLAADQLRPDESKLEKVRGMGVTTALTAPRTGIVQGQSALINLAGEKPAKLIVKSPVALHAKLGQDENFRTYPGSLMGVISYLRQTLLDAQHYSLEQERYKRIQRGVPRPEPDPTMDAWQPILARQLPVVFLVDEAKEIQRIIKLAEEFNLKYIISGASEGYEVAGLLRDKQIPVLVSLNFPTQPRDADPEADVPLRVLRRRAEAPKTPATLHQAGVKFAFTSGFMSEPGDFIRNAARAVKAGLPEEAALKAMTINAAEIFGVAEQLGSVEAGKIANLVVTTGDLFNERTTIKHLFIDGREIELKKAPERPERPEPDARPTVMNVAGAWSLSVETPQGAVPVSATLQQTGTQITGMLSSMYGDNKAEGSISGNRLRLKTQVNLDGQLTPVDFEATVEGTTMKGTVSVQGQGDFALTGTRPES